MVGRLIGRALANRYREDLDRAGLGSGCHSFELTPPPGLAFAPDSVEVRRSLDGVALAFSTEAQAALARSASHEVASNRNIKPRRGGRKALIR